MLKSGLFPRRKQQIHAFCLRQQKCRTIKSAVANKKDVSKLTIFSAALSLTSHNSHSLTLDAILTTHNESEKLSDSVCPLKVQSSACERELCDVKGRVTKNGVSIDTSFLLATAEMHTTNEYREYFIPKHTRLIPENIQF